MIKKFFLRKLPYFILSGIIIIIFHSWLTTKILCKGDCVFFYSDNLASFFAPPYFWNTSPHGSGFGFYALPTIVFAPPPILLGSLYYFLGFEFNIIEKIAWFIPFLVLSSSGMIWLAGVLGIGKWGRCFAGLFYITNTYILLVIDGGQVGIALAYSLLPFVLASFIKSLRENEAPQPNDWGIFSPLLRRERNPSEAEIASHSSTSLRSRFSAKGDDLKQKITTGLLLAILMLFDLRVAYLTFIIIFSYLIFSFITKKLFSKQYIFNIFSSTVFITVIPLSLHFFWIGPLISTNTTGISSFYTQTAQIDFLSWMNLLNSLFLFQPHWPENIFGRIHLVPYYFFLIPILVFISTLINRRKEILFFSFIAIFSIFLIKGSNEPAGEIYSFLFSNIPGFNLFRDPSKFYIPLTLSYSLLIAFSLENISEWLKKQYPNFKSASMIFFLLTLFYLLFLIKPVFTREMTGTFHPQNISSTYLQIRKTLIDDKNFSRSIWYPNKREFSYSSPNHPALDAALDLFRLRPFDIFIAGDYDLFSYLSHPFAEELFDLLGIKYVFFSYPIKEYLPKESEIKDYQRLLKTISQIKWLQKTGTSQNIISFQTKSKPDHFFAVNKTFSVVGSDSLYETLASFSDFKLKQLGLVYLDEFANPINEKDLQDVEYLVFNNKSQNDLTFLLADKKYLIFPATTIKNETMNGKIWQKIGPFDLISWRDTLARKGFNNLDFDLGGGFIFADDYPQSAGITLFLEEDRVGDFNIRYFSNHLGGEITLKIDGKLIKTINTKSFQNNFIWEKVDELELKKGNHVIFLENSNGFNAVNVLAFIPDRIMKSYQQTTSQIINQKKSIYFYDVNEATKSVGLNIPFSGEYQVLIQTTQLPTGEIKFKINGKIYNQVIENKIGDRWYSVGNFSLNNNQSKIEIENPETFEKIIFFQNKNESFEKLLGSLKNAPVVYGELINPTKYRLWVKNVNQPFDLVFSERFHPGWEVKIKSQLFKSKQFYSIINGFHIVKSGDLEFELEFAPQRLMLPSLVISLVSLVGAITILIYLTVKNDRRSF